MNDERYAPMPPSGLSPSANARQAWQDGYHEAVRRTTEDTPHDACGCMKCHPEQNTAIGSEDTQ